MSDLGTALAVIQPQLDTLKAELNTNFGLLNSNLNLIRQAIEQLADVAEKATRGEDVTADLGAARANLYSIIDVYAVS